MAILGGAIGGTVSGISQATAWSTNADLNTFRDYIRIPTVHPDIDYGQAILFLMAQATALGLPMRVFNAGGDPTKPVAVITWEGSEPALPSIELNSHMDVVPADPSLWTHPPYAADIDEAGRIFGRGTQDMKSVGMQYLAAIKALRAAGVRNKRTVHVTFVPDEEIGGATGMGTFVTSCDFRNLNVGFSLDEGGPSPTEIYTVFYAERSAWFIEFIVNGTPGHGSLLFPNSAGEKLSYVLRKMYEYRDAEIAKMAKNANVTMGDVTTINLTRLTGGVQDNVVPPQMKMTFDIRLAITVVHAEFEAMLRRWCTEAGGGIELKFTFKSPLIEPTRMDAANIFWGAFQSALNDDLGVQFAPAVFPGGTDSRYIRALGVPVLGFSPMKNTPVLLHGNDEYIGADTYLEGVRIYKTLIPKLANA